MDERTEELRVGWCPGALRPMAAGDGLLLRIKPRGNRLTLAQARGIASTALRFGNGVLTLTGRANIQLRGLREATLDDALAALAPLGLLDADAAGEAARNLVSSPPVGRPAFAVAPSVAALEEALAHDDPFRRLPAKFAWTVDDGSALDLSALASDVRFTAVVAGADACFRIVLPGTGAAATCEPKGLVATSAALAGAFLALCTVERMPPHRMGDLVARVGAARIFAAADLTTGAPPLPVRPPTTCIGNLGHGAVGIAPPFGRLEAATLESLAETAGIAGAAALVLTPWRSLVIPDVADAGWLLSAAARLGFIGDPRDPRLAAVACAGQPACRRAEAPVQIHAALLAPLLAPATGMAIRLHLSGCAKGCAHPGPAPLTAVARASRYDLVVDGRPGDSPDAAGLPLAALAARLGARTPPGAVP